MDGYGQFCPIALGAEVFAERWTPIILRNLMVGCERFGEILAGAPGLPRSVLTRGCVGWSATASSAHGAGRVALLPAHRVRRRADAGVPGAGCVGGPLA